MRLVDLPEADGVTWPGPLRFDYAALLTMEREQQRGLRKMFSAGQDFEIIGLLVTYGLRHCAPQIKLNHVVKLIQCYLDASPGNTLNDLMGPCLEALNASGMLKGMGDDAGAAGDDPLALTNDTTVN